jgi:hypothetical protein
MAEPAGLVVIWATGDRDVALYSAIMYAHNAKKYHWWEQVRFLVWGSSSRLLSEDAEVQEAILAMARDGVEVAVCKACSDRLGVSGQLEALGLPVFYVGELLTESLKGGWVPLTY